MNLLVLGGTVFLGRHIVEAALARGHTVTLFNRGQHNADLFPEVEKLRGDRDGGLDALRGRRWDAAIDPSGYLPRLVRASAELLADAVDRYCFISSISVYEKLPVPGMDESAPVGMLADPTTEEITGESYGPLKALCEQAVEAALPGRALVIRPGLIVGPHDPTDRFTYWPVRVARGGEVLAPSSPASPVQVIDVRDLAEWTIQMVESRRTGTFNATGPAEALTLGSLLETCRTVSANDARFTWVSEEFIAQNEVSEWMDLPLWIASADQNMAGFQAVSIGRALDAGLLFRPLEATVRDTLAWHATRPASHEWRAGLAPTREAELLARWHAETGNTE
jgi:2'-hydroxyisoflavone reductase